MSEQRRFRSKHVAYGLVGTVLLGCCGFGLTRDLTQSKHCVDTKTRQQLHESSCQSGGQGTWIYGGRSSGGKVTGGSYDRGGFGRFFSGGS